MILGEDETAPSLPDEAGYEIINGRTTLKEEFEEGDKLCLVTDLANVFDRGEPSWSVPLHIGQPDISKIPTIDLSEKILVNGISMSLDTVLIRPLGIDIRLTTPGLVDTETLRTAVNNIDIELTSSSGELLLRLPMIDIKTSDGVSSIHIRSNGLLGGLDNMTLRLYYGISISPLFEGKLN